MRPPYSLSCGRQVPDVGLPHDRDARMQRSPVQCPSTLHTGKVNKPDCRGHDLHNLIKTARSPTTVTAASLTTEAEGGNLR